MKRRRGIGRAAGPPRNPVRVWAVVASSDEDVSVTLAVKGGEEAEVGGLGYEATFRAAE